MRKALVISGILLSGPLLGGVAFLVGSHATRQSKADAQEWLHKQYDEMMAQSILYRTQRRFDEAQWYARQAIDFADTKQMRAAGGYLMGQALYEDWDSGGNVSLEAPLVYLKAARRSSDSPKQRAEIDLLLLETLWAKGEEGEYARSLDLMLAEAIAPEEQITLWRKRFEFLLGPAGSWSAMEAALKEAANSPIDWAEWVDLLADTRLRKNEKLLVDASWFDEMAAAESLADPAAFRKALFAESHAALKNMAESMLARRAQAHLRLARILVASGAYDEGLSSLQDFVESKPEEDLTEALELVSTISRNTLDQTVTVPLANTLVRLQDMNVLSQRRVEEMVALLEGMGMLDEALEVVDGRLSLIGRTSRHHAGLLVQKIMLEEQLDHRAKAIEGMVELRDLECNREMGTALSRLIEFNLARSDYASIEEWVQQFASWLPGSSGDRVNAYYALYESKYWLERPLAEQLVVGAAAVQAGPDDPRAQSVELRMAEAIENMRLDALAVSYYNRIGLLNFLQGDEPEDTAFQSVSEQAILGKARCLKKMGDWIAANKLYRGLCQRTQSPMIRSEAAVGWAEIALRDKQFVEARRRFELAHGQMLSPADQVRYMMGMLEMGSSENQYSSAAIETNLEMLGNLPDDEQRTAVIDFFNQAFEYLYQAKDEPTMVRLIDLACQSPFAAWLPIEGYVLRTCEDKVELARIDELKSTLERITDVTDMPMDDLVRVVDRLDGLSKKINRQ